MNHRWPGLIFFKRVSSGPFPSHPVFPLSSSASPDCAHFPVLQALELVPHILTHLKPNVTKSFVPFIHIPQSTEKSIDESQSDSSLVSF